MPKTIHKDSMIIVGEQGSGFETGAIWQKFTDLYDKYGMNEQISENEIYKVKILYGRKFDVHIGRLSTSMVQTPLYKILTIPPFEYVVFECKLSDYNNHMQMVNEWLENNPLYEQGLLNNNKFIIEYYGPRFNEDDFDESIIEIYLPIVKKQD
ncbi:MAG TPA: GyrI-like domain-containing protein [Haloplasmataceae bacterium]